MNRKSFSLVFAGALFLVGWVVRAQELSSAKLRDLDFPPEVLEKPVRPDSVDPERWSKALAFEMNQQWVPAGEQWSEIAGFVESDLLYLRSAACYLRAGAFAEALRELNRSVALSPKRSAIEEHLRALAHWEAGDFRQAWKMLMLLIRSEDVVGMHHYHLLTRVALSQNDRAEAIGWARKVAEKGRQEDRENYFNNPAFTILERSRLYTLIKKDALDPTRKTSREQDWIEGDEALAFWQINLSLTNHTQSVTNNTMQLSPEWNVH